MNVNDAVNNNNSFNLLNEGSPRLKSSLKFSRCPSSSTSISFKSVRFAPELTTVKQFDCNSEPSSISNENSPDLYPLDELNHYTNFFSGSAMDFNTMIDQKSTNVNLSTNTNNNDCFWFSQLPILNSIQNEKMADFALDYDSDTSVDDLVYNQNFNNNNNNINTTNNTTIMNPHMNYLQNNNINTQVFDNDYNDDYNDNNDDELDHLINNSYLFSKELFNNKNKNYTYSFIHSTNNRYVNNNLIDGYKNKNSGMHTDTYSDIIDDSFYNLGYSQNPFIIKDWELLNSNVAPFFSNQDEDLFKYLHNANIRLNSVNQVGNIIAGSILVNNLNYEKFIEVKFTFNNWKDIHYVTAQFCKSITDNIDKFEFTIDFNSFKYLLQFKGLIFSNIDTEFTDCNLNIELCCRYLVNNETYYDNNNYENYKFDLSLRTENLSYNSSSNKNITEVNVGEKLNTVHNDRVSNIDLNKCSLDVDLMKRKKIPENKNKTFINDFITTTTLSHNSNTVNNSNISRKFSVDTDYYNTSPLKHLYHNDTTLIKPRSLNSVVLLNNSSKLNKNNIVIPSGTSNLINETDNDNLNHKDKNETALTISSAVANTETIQRNSNNNTNYSTINNYIDNTYNASFDNTNNTNNNNVNNNSGCDTIPSVENYNDNNNFNRISTQSKLQASIASTGKTNKTNNRSYENLQESESSDSIPSSLSTSISSHSVSTSFSLNNIGESVAWGDYKEGNSFGFGNKSFLQQSEQFSSSSSSISSLPEEFNFNFSSIPVPTTLNSLLSASTLPRHTPRGLQDNELTHASSNNMYNTSTNSTLVKDIDKIISLENPIVTLGSPSPQILEEESGSTNLFDDDIHTIVTDTTSTLSGIGLVNQDEELSANYFDEYNYDTHTITALSNNGNDSENRDFEDNYENDNGNNLPFLFKSDFNSSLDTLIIQNSPSLDITNDSLSCNQNIFNDVLNARKPSVTEQINPSNDQIGNNIASTDLMKNPYDIREVHKVSHPYDFLGNMKDFDYQSLLH